MKIAQSKHDFLWCVSILPLYFMMLTARSGLQDQDLEHFNISVQDKNDLVEEVTTEISVYLGMIYHIVEVFKGHEDFADELSAFVQAILTAYTDAPHSESRPSAPGLLVQRRRVIEGQVEQGLSYQEGA